MVVPDAYITTPFFVSCYSRASPHIPYSAYLESKTTVGLLAGCNRIYGSRTYSVWQTLVVESAAILCRHCHTSDRINLEYMARPEKGEL